MKKRFDELSPFKIVHHDWRRHYPLHVEIDPTSRCNQDCLRCSYKQEIDGARDYIIQHQNSELPLARFRDLVKEFSELGIKAVTFSGGGDPLVYPHLDTVIGDLLRHNICFGVISNLATRKDLAALSRAVWIRVSLDAASAATYNLLHRPANPAAFDLALDNMAALVRLNPMLDLGVNYLLQPENADELLEAGRIVKGLGARYIRYVPAIATDAVDYPRLLADSAPLLEQSKNLIDQDFHVFVIKERFDSLADRRKNYSFCHKQRIHPLIGADGNLYPCCLLKYYRRHVLGSVLHASFREVWNGERRKQWLHCLDVDQCPPCWFDKTNEFMEYLSLENPKHVEFV